MLLHRAGTALLALLAGLALTAPAARGQLLDLQSQTRTVGIQIDHHERHWTCFPYTPDPECQPDFIITTSYSEDDVAPDAGPWVAIASLAQFPDTFASQDSEITGRWIRASGGQRATSYYETWDQQFPITDIEEPHSSATSFSATFVVAADARYRLTGSVSTAAGLWSVSTAFIRLTGPDAQVVAEVQLSRSWDDCEPWPDCWMMGPEPIAASGLLPPGTYTLDAGATGDAGGYAKFGFGDVAFGDFDLELVLGPPVPAIWNGEVPALSSGGLAVLALSLVCAALWLARRQRIAND